MSERGCPSCGHGVNPHLPESLPRLYFSLWHKEWRWFDRVPTALWREVPMMYEDELPEMSDDEYKEWFESSAVVDGVRMGRRAGLNLRAPDAGGPQDFARAWPSLMNKLTEEEKDALSMALRYRQPDSLLDAIHRAVNEAIGGKVAMSEIPGVIRERMK
jgi:hypothetical protein